MILYLVVAHAGKLQRGTHSLGHTNTCIADCQSLVVFIGYDVDAEVLAGIEFAWVRKGLIANLVKSIGRVRDQFPQEDFLVRVDCVYDEREKLGDLSLKLEGLARHDCGGKESILPRKRSC